MMTNYKMKEDKALMKNIKVKNSNIKCSNKKLEVIHNRSSLRRLSNLSRKIWLKININIKKCQQHLFLMSSCRHLF
jgi:hypothetical protein